MGKYSRREFLKLARMLPLLPMGIHFAGKRIDEDPLIPERREKPGTVTKETFTPMQTLVNVEPPEYDMDKFYKFFKTNYPGSERIVPIVSEGCGRHSKTYHMDPLLVMSQIFQESKFDPAAISWVGAGGLMQFMPETAKDMGIEDVYSPEYYEDAWETYRDARKPRNTAKRYRNLFDRAIKLCAKSVLKEKGIKASDMSKEDEREVEKGIRREFLGVEGAAERAYMVAEELRKEIVNSYRYFEDRIEDFKGGILDVINGKGVDKIEETYKSAIDDFNTLLGGFSDLEDDVELLSEIEENGSRLSQFLSKSVTNELRYEELREEAKEEFGKYVDDIRRKILKGFKPGMYYKKGRFELISPEERKEFDGRFHEATNIDKGVKYDSLLAKRFKGNMAYAMCAFNSGPGNVHLELETNSGKKVYVLRIPFFRETVRYWDNIYDNFNKWYLSVI